MELQTEKIAGGVVTDHGAVPRIEIRDVSEPERLSELEGLQVRVWGSAPSTIVPVHVLHIVATSGGIVLAAYAGERPVGFAFGFLARSDGPLYHASHMLGIDPAYQGYGIGATLKLAQRERALAQGLGLMTWTFDPLEARNAYFNLHKLGVISRSYKQNAYGELHDELNRGLPSDRLVVEWRLRDVARARGSAGRDGVLILADEGGLPSLRLERGFEGQLLRVATPKDIQQLKRAAPDRALEWRLAQRAAMSWALERGYIIHDFISGTFVLKRGEDSDYAD